MPSVTTWRPTTRAHKSPMTSPGSGGRRKLEPDPRVRAAILSAAARIVRSEGIGALSIAGVLARAVAIGARVRRGAARAASRQTAASG